MPSQENKTENQLSDTEGAEIEKITQEVYLEVVDSEKKVSDLDKFEH